MNNIDYSKAYITLSDKEEFQVLDKDGEFDGPATQKLIEEYLASSK